MYIEKEILIFADADFLSSFLRIGLKDFLLDALKDNEIIVPYTVAKEIRVSRDLNLVNEFNSLIRERKIKEEPEISTDSEVFKNMMAFISVRDSNYPEFGEGELEALALAYTNDAYIASNNLKHITVPCQDFNIKYFSSTDILKKAHKNKLKTIEELDLIWTQMKSVQTLPPFGSFSEYLKKGE